MAGSWADFEAIGLSASDCFGLRGKVGVIPHKLGEKHGKSTSAVAGLQCWQRGEETTCKKVEETCPNLLGDARFGCFCCLGDILGKLLLCMCEGEDGYGGGATGSDRAGDIVTGQKSIPGATEKTTP